MAKDPKMLVQIGADISGLRKGTRDASKEMGGFKNKLKSWAKSAALAFAGAAAAAAAFATTLAVDGVKAALEDAKAQRLLATQLKKTTKATDAQLAVVENWVSATSLAYGITDDKLRPALSRLVRSTKDVSQAQNIMNLALDVAAGTGKDFDSVVNALSKAYDGSNTALGRLGTGISKADLASQTFSETFSQLKTQFQGFAADEANTTEGKIRRLGIAWDEIQEQVGFALLPTLESLSDWFTNEGMKGIQTFFDVLLGNDPKVGENVFLKSGKHFDTFRENELTPTQESFGNLAQSIKDLGTELGQLFEDMDLQNPNSDFNTLIDGLSDVAGFLSKIVTFIKFIDTNSPSIMDLPDKWNQGVENFNDFWGRDGSGFGIDLGKMFGMTQGSASVARPNVGGTTIIVNGALDPVATARTVAKAQAQASRLGGTGVAGIGVG